MNIRLEEEVSLVVGLYVHEISRYSGTQSSGMLTDIVVGYHDIPYAEFGIGECCIPILEVQKLRYATPISKLYCTWRCRIPKADPKSHQTQSNHHMHRQPQPHESIVQMKTVQWKGTGTYSVLEMEPRAKSTLNGSP